MINFFVSLFKSCSGEIDDEEIFIVQTAVDEYLHNRKYHYFYKILKTIDEIGYFPSVTISPNEMMCKLSHYRTIILKEQDVDIAYYHKYFGDFPKSIKMEMIVWCNEFNSISELRDSFAFGSLTRNWVNKLSIDENGQSFVHHAVKCRQLSLLKCLLETGEDVNLKDKAGNTPLFYTFSTKHKDGETVKLLLKYGADVNITNKQGQTFTEKAKIKRNYTNLALIEK